MTVGLAAAGMALAVATHSVPKAPTKQAATRAVRSAPAPTPPASVRPAALPMLPRVARVRVEAARDRVVVIEEVHLPRGDWQSGGLDVYVAFGSPGTPIAIDARIMTPGPGGPDARPEEPGETVTLEPAPRRTSAVQPLLGKGQMAGVIAHVKEAQLRRAYAVGDTAVLRLRSLLVAPAADPTGARGVVVRLGVSGGQPLTVARIQVASLEAQPWIARAEATLCGPEADPWPLTVAIAANATTATSTATAATKPTIAPELAVRHASDDLCIRWWGRR